MPRKYTFGWDDAAAVEIPKLDEFRERLISLCREFGIGFEMDGLSEYPRLEVVSFDSADFDDFFRNLREYGGGVHWLDEAKKRYEQRYAELSAERRKAEAAQAAVIERQLYERLRAKLETTR